MFTVRLARGPYFHGTPWASNVFLRNSVDGWDKNITGQQVGADVVFTLATVSYAPAFDLKFLIQGTLGEIWMSGLNLTISPVDQMEYAFDGRDVSFPFLIRFRTTYELDRSLYTLRTAHDGWQSEIHGNYGSPFVDFNVDFAHYANRYGDDIEPMEFKILRYGIWAKGPNMTVYPWPGSVHYLTDAEVKFPFPD